MKLATTIVALASDSEKLKWFALNAAQGALKATKAMTAS
jgi:hypothetical protein